MTTLAIIGSGIIGRSLIYTLAKEGKSFEKITLFYSDSFAFPCTLHSTATVAPRGLSSGHSSLGDLLMESFKTFKEHVELDLPLGVEKVPQYTGANEKLETFKTRYPNGSVTKKPGILSLHDETYVAEEEAYLIDPKTYSNWLMNEAQKMLQNKLEVIHDFVVEVRDNERVHLKTQNGRELAFDKVIFAGGSYNRYWMGLAPTSKLKTSKAIQGSYLEFNHVTLNVPSFSLTLDGDNLIWNAPLKRLLVGSTTLETHHVLPPVSELRAIYDRIKTRVEVTLPEFKKAEIKVGLREKAQKRSPYLFEENKKIFVGGCYKNGYSLGLRMARETARQFL